jgi:diguanylate cyclase (GGDEF)-like protein
VTTVAELMPNSTVCLFRYLEHPTPHFKNVVALLAQVDDSGINEYQWDVPIPESTKLHICENFNDFSKFTEYRTNDEHYHIFIPLHVENKLYFALDVCSEYNVSAEIHALKAITRVCENFYAVLSCCEKDSLTGLYNRRTYDQKLSNLLQRQYRNQKISRQLENENRKEDLKGSSWLAVVDIDLFKRVNDKFGHIYGDEVLLILSQLMQKSFRHNDLLFRFGGEEFLLIFEPTSKAKVIHVLEK